MSLSLRTRLTALAGVLFAVTLLAAGVLMIGAVEREARSSAVAAIERTLGERAEAIAGDADPAKIRVSVGDGIEFGLFRREGPLAFGSMFIDGQEVAIVELNLSSNQVNELLDPETYRDVTDPDVISAADRLFLVTRQLEGDGTGTLLVGAAPPTSVEVSTDAARRALALILPPIWLVGVVVTWLTVGRTLRPVEAVTDRARRISSENLHERVPVPKSSDEVARLATTINAMLARLEHGDAQRRQFSADVSHELRSPLATIRSAADVIVAHPDRAAELAPEIVTGADRIDGIIDDLLALASIEQSDTKTFEVIDLVAIVQESVGDVTAPDAVRVEVVSITPVQVAGNESQLRRAVENLVANAVRHAYHSVRVTIGHAGTTAEVQVEDDGPGVPDDKRDEVFERFVRLDDARARDDGGVGLGLSLVKAVVEAHSGAIEVGHSDALGGARFAIAMPAASA